MSTRRRPRRRLIALGAGVVALVLLAAAAYVVMNSRSFHVAGRLVDRVDTDEKVVALTFDDGPTAADADAILAALASRGGRATFYVNGATAASNPGQLERLVAAGHELGNHTTDHRRLIRSARARSPPRSNPPTRRSARRASAAPSPSGRRMPRSRSSHRSGWPSTTAPP